jgi:hypothetical protein
MMSSAIHRPWSAVGRVCILAACACVISNGSQTPGNGVPVDAKWKREGTLSYAYAAKGRGGASNESLTLTFLGGDAARVDGPAGRSDVAFAPSGAVALAAGMPPVPPWVDLFQVGPGLGKALRVGESAEFRLPADADIANDTLTVQSEVEVTLASLAGNVATYSFETSYRVVDNQALAHFRADAKEAGGGSSDYVDAMIDDALAFRLAGFGTVEFDVGDGRLVRGSFTGAGLPLAQLDAQALAARADAVTYEIELQAPGGTP